MTPVTLRIRVAPEPVEVTVWPLRDEPLITTAMLLVAAAVVAGVTLASQSFWPGIAAFILLGCTLWRRILPITIAVGQSGVRQEILGRWSLIPWGSIHSLQIHPRGVLLLPDRTHNLLSPLRGVMIPLGRDKADILALLDYYLHQSDHQSNHR